MTSFEVPTDDERPRAPLVLLDLGNVIYSTVLKGREQSGDGRLRSAVTADTRQVMG